MNAQAPAPRQLVIGAGMYPFLLELKSQGKVIFEHFDDICRQLKAAGVQAWEPMLPVPQSPDQIAEMLHRHGLTMPTAYLNARLHESDWQTRNDAVVRQAEALRPIGMRNLVLNPEPIGWNLPDNKTDAQLARQAAALRQLHGKLLDAGVVLTYHTHDSEMRQAAREVHHMMLATDDLPSPDGKPQAGMRMCFDAHWFFRGTGDSNLAVFDMLKLYGRRVASLHLRQSHGGVWSDSLDGGGVDYARLVRELFAMGFEGPAVLEIAREKNSPKRIPLEEAHRLSVEQWRAWECAAAVVA